MGRIDCFERYDKDLGWRFTGVFPAPEFKALLDKTLEVNDSFRGIGNKYGLTLKDFEDWLEKQNPAKERIFGGRIVLYDGYFRYKSVYLKEKLGEAPAAIAYEKLVEEHERLSDVYDKKAQYYKEQAKTLDALYPVQERKLNPKIDEIYAMFEIIKDKYGLTREEFYVWLKARGINGRVIAGFMEVIPGIEMYELTFLKEQLGDVPEIQVYEELAAGFAASEEPFILKYLNKQKREG